MSLNKFEKSAIIIILIIGLLGGVALVYLQQPPIISAIFIAMGISMVVYHFLGGIEVAQFNMGPIKLGGSIAALIASAWMINTGLEGQNSRGEVNLNSRHELFNSNNKLLGILPIRNYNIGANKDFEIQLNDSIKLGKLELDDLELTDDFKIRMSDSITIGSINPSNFKELGMFTDFETDIYTEIKYNLKLSAPFTSKLNTKYWEDNPHLDLMNNLPFSIKPVYQDGRLQTEITIDDETKKYKLLDDRGETKLFYPDKKPSIYLIRVRGLTLNKGANSYNNFVVYQIYGFSRTIKGKSIEY